MSDSNEVSSLYPPPPPFVQFFTDRNCALLEECKADESRLATLTAKEKTQLQYLQKPELPENGTYRVFGNVWKIKDELPELSEMGIEQLYKKQQDSAASEEEPRLPQSQSSVNYENKIHELKRLLKSLLLNFLELIGILGVDSSLYEKKLEEIRVIAINIHHLLNEYRPHQSRELLILLLEEQLEHKRRETERINKVCDEVEAKLKDL